MNWSRLLTLAATGCLVAAAWACGTDAVGIEACREIEGARCELAPACGIDMSIPKHWGGSGTDVTSCQRYYRDACLHGLASGIEPGNVALQDCVAAVRAGDCNVVRTPELHPACAFLIPPAPPPEPVVVDDAGADATSDAAIAP